MLAMYDEKEILREYIEYEKYHAAKKAEKLGERNGEKKNAIKMIKAGKLSIEDIKEIEKELMQTVQKVV